MGEDAYGGLFGAFPYAFRHSESLALRSYVVVGGLLAAFAALLVTMGLVQLVAATTGGRGGVLTLSRSFYVLVGLGVVAPLVAPVLFAARRHRREGGTRRRDAALGLAGYLFVASLYVGLLVTVPEAHRSEPAGPLAPAVATLYALPALWGLLPPVAGALVVVLVHRLT